MNFARTRCDLKILMQRFRVVYHGISRHEHSITILYLKNGISHERAFYNYFIPCPRKYSRQHNQSDLAVLYSDWLYTNANVFGK